MNGAIHSFIDRITPVFHFFIFNSLLIKSILAFNLNEDCSYEESIFVANQLKQALKFNLEQALYAIHKFVVKGSQRFFSHI
jgi:hypothetical protein